MRTTINECGVILFNKNFDQLLIIFQNESLKWGLPKGHLDRAELASRSYYDCAKRELLEETGIMINTHKHRKMGTLRIRDKLFYILQLMKEVSLRQPIDTREIGGVMWLPVNNFMSFLKQYKCNITLKELDNYMSTTYEFHHKIANG